MERADGAAGPTPDLDLDQVFDRVDEHREELIQRLVAYASQPSVSSTGEGIAEAAELACNVKLLLDGEEELGSPQPARVRGGPQGPARRRPGDLERRSGARERPLVPGVRRSAGSSPSSCAPGAPTGWTAAGCWPRSASNASTSPPTVASTNGWWHGPPSRSTGCAVATAALAPRPSCPTRRSPSATFGWCPTSGPATCSPSWRPMSPGTRQGSSWLGAGTWSRRGRQSTPASPSPCARRWSPPSARSRCWSRRWEVA